MESEAGSTMEFMKEMLSTVRERMKSKLISSFVIAWLVYNYQLVLVIVGDGGYADKLYYISNEMKYDGFSVLSPSFIWPLVIALIYIWIVPVIEGGVYFLQMYCVGLKKMLMMKADGIPPISKDELDTVRSDLGKTIKMKEDEINANRDVFNQETGKIRSDVHRLTEDLYRQIIFRFITESGLNKDEYNVLAGPAHGNKLRSFVSEEFRKTPTFNGLKCFYEKTNKINGHHNTGERFIDRDELSMALDQFIPSEQQYDFIYLLKAMQLLSDGAGWAVNKYMLISDSRMVAVNAFLEQLIAEPNPQST